MIQLLRKWLGGGDSILVFYYFKETISINLF